VNQLFTYNALTNDSCVFDLTAKVETASLLPRTEAALKKINYEWLCDNSASVVEIDSITFNELIDRTNVVAIDVREEGELPEVTEFDHIRMPLSTLQETISSITSDTILFFCKSGKRSEQAARLLSATFGGDKKVYSLQGGIVQWKKEQYGKKA
jgi:adenylyltransferase/sulfurtransferase